MSGPAYPVSTIAKLLDLTERRVQQLTKEGVLPKADRGRYELAPVVRAYVRYLRERSIPAEAEAAGESFQMARARRTAAQAELAELRTAEARGKVIPEDDVREVLTAVVGRVRSKLLAIPTKLAPHLLGLERLADAQERLKSGIHEALAELAGTQVAGISVSENEEPSGA